MEEQLVEKGGRKKNIKEGNGGMEEAPENGNESQHSANADEMNEFNMGVTA